MLCIKQILALGLGLPSFILLIIVAYYLYRSFKHTNEFYKPKKYNISIIADDKNLTRHLDDESYVFAINLEVFHPNSILVVGEHVDVSGISTIAPSDMKVVAIFFDNAQAYPTTLDENGVIKSGILYLNRAQDNKFVGATKISWPAEGRYNARFQMEFDDGTVSKRIIHDTAVFTVYPKSVAIQTETNFAILLLAFAAYFIGFLGLIVFIYQLLQNP
jgi:hypothetical protein